MAAVVAAGIGAAGSVGSALLGGGGSSGSQTQTTQNLPAPQTEWQRAQENAYMQALYGSQNLAAMNVFDPEFYYTAYPDLQTYILEHPEEVEKAGGQDAWLEDHWLEVGMNEGRNGNWAMAGVMPFPDETMAGKIEATVDEKRMAGEKLNALFGKTTEAKIREVNRATEDYLGDLGGVESYYTDVMEGYGPEDFLGRGTVSYGGDTYTGFTTARDAEMMKFHGDQQMAAAGGLESVLADAYKVGLFGAEYGPTKIEEQGQRRMALVEQYPEHQGEIDAFMGLTRPDYIQDQSFRYGLPSSTETSSADYDQGYLETIGDIASITGDALDIYDLIVDADKVDTNEVDIGGYGGGVRV